MSIEAGSSNLYTLRNDIHMFSLVDENLIIEREPVVSIEC